MVTLILARLLTPKEFGLIGMLTIFILVSQTLVNGGFNQALIRQQDVDEEDYSTVFYINLIVSLILYLILFFAAPLIADFYDQHELTLLTRVLSTIFLINAFSYVQEAKLTKEMQFKKLMFINLPSTIIGGMVSIIMAMKGHGVWSIVALQLITKLAYSMQIWAYSSWRPMAVFNKERALSLFSFGGKLALSGVINTIYQNIYLVVIGKFFSVSNVGYYQNANNLVQYPVNTFSMALNKVVFSAFSSIQNDNRKLKEGYKMIIRQILFWVCPAFIIAGVLAVPLFRFIFTEKWLPAVPYFQWLCVVGILLPVNSYNLNILNVKGRSDLFLRLEIIKKIIISIGLVIAIPFGIKALLIFQAFNSFLAYGLNSYYSGRFVHYPISEQIKDILPILFLGLFIGLLVGVADYYMLNNQSDWLRIAIGVGGGFSLYLFIAKRFRFSSFLDFEVIVRTKLLKKSLI